MMMRKLLNALMIFVLLLIIFRNVQAKDSPKGITFNVLRVVYPASEKGGVTLTLRNNTPAVYLMQSRIQAVDPKTGDVNITKLSDTKFPFIITPPLSRFEANGELTLRIRRNDAVLPTDRESVFYISMKALPTQSTGKQTVVMTVVSNIKLFYRPEGLARRAVADIAQKVTFFQEGKLLIAHNPTPYWLTFSRLSVGGILLDKPSLRLMIPPFGSQHYTLPATASGRVTWQLIDEDGWDTKVFSQD
ncbi:molecular chaperone [Klebsiella sp. CN_Kp118]|uniref:fimbrial biogenesis chaperone n=2 Tax=Klebsiella TaxID=570 RepID=UPI0032B38A9B